MSQRLSPSSQTNYIVDKNKLYNSEINSDNKVIIKHEESNLFNNDVSENNSIIKNTKKLSEDDINEINLLNIKNTEEIHNFSAQEFADNTHLNFYIQLSIENKYNMLNFTEYKNILDSDIFNSILLKLLPGFEKKLLNIDTIIITGCTKIHLSDENIISNLKTLYDNGGLKKLYISKSQIEEQSSERMKKKTIINYLEKTLPNCLFYDEKEFLLNSFKY